MIYLKLIPPSINPNASRSKIDWGKKSIRAAMNKKIISAFEYRNGAMRQEILKRVER